jgi:hypothetical protein
MNGGGEKFQSTCAELAFGRFLCIHDVTDNYVPPSRNDVPPKRQPPLFFPAGPQT